MVYAKTWNEDHIYVLTGGIHLTLTLLFGLFGITLVFRFKTKYGSWIGYVLIISGIIQCIMAVIMIINQHHPAFSLNFVFEALGFYQQSSYYLVMVFIGGVYNKQQFDQNTWIKKIYASFVC